VFSVSDKKSFENIKFWDNTVCAIAPNCMKILIGNKTDGTNAPRIVSNTAAKSLKEELKFDVFVETSAKNSDNVQQLLAHLQDLGVKSATRHLKAKPTWLQVEKVVEKQMAPKRESEKEGCGC